MSFDPKFHQKTADYVAFETKHSNKLLTMKAELTEFGWEIKRHNKTLKKIYQYKFVIKELLPVN